MAPVHVSRLIAATAERVRAILTDIDRLMSGDFGMQSLTGRLAPSGQITLRPDIAPGRALRPRVAEWSPPNRMVWIGGTALGLFTGRRTFTLTPDDGRTRFEMSEAASGWLTPLILRSMLDLTPSFEAFAAALAQRAEQEVQ